MGVRVASVCLLRAGEAETEGPGTKGQVLTRGRRRAPHIDAGGDNLSGTCSKIAL